MDLNEIMNRAKAAQAQALESLEKMEEKADALADAASPRQDAAVQEDARQAQAAAEAAQAAANQARQVEVLGQMFDADALAAMAASQEQFRQMVSEQTAAAAAMGAEAVMGQLFGEDMALVSAALETLAMEEGDGWDDLLEDREETEEELYTLLEETMARLEALPEPPPADYGKDPASWQWFGVLLSGIVSTLNDHRLDGMDVEDHIPVMEQQITSLLRRSWGIDGRGELLETLRYLTREGYAVRYQLFADTASPEELLCGEEDEDERQGTIRTWNFVQRYKGRYSPAFLAGWDLGRAAMLTRWGCFVGWLTESEAAGFLWDIGQKAAEDLGGWREFAQSYLFGGLMWKLLCASPAAGYLGQLADAATTLLAGGPQGKGGQWAAFAWPARRKLGFSL